MNEPIAYLNGEFLPAAQAKLNVFDLGVIQGATFSEMTRTFNGALFRAGEHVARLFASLRYGGIAIPLTPDEVLDITRQVAEHNAQLLNAGEDLAVVQFVTAGESAMYADGQSTRDQPTVCIHSFRLPFARWRSFFQNGARVAVPSTRHLPPQCVDPKTKNRSRLHWHLAEREVKQGDPDAIPLLLDLEGNLTETPGANVLIYRNDTVFSPTSRNILGGISLQTVREIAREIGIDWVEKDLQFHDALNADEAWLTSTPYGIAPCTRINGAAIGGGEPGPGWKRVLSVWSERVNCDIAAQILNH
jgi:branched-subunit amino acid aminotransferase/4-amino-4-deoxychorismate lyase